MSARIVATLALVLSSCGGAPPVVRANAAAPSGPAPAEWAEHEIAGEGISVRFPSEPLESAGFTPGSPSFPYRGLEVESEKHQLSVLELVVGPRGPDEVLLTSADKLVSKVSKRTAMDLDGFRGIEVVGESEKKEAKAVRAFAMGRSIVFLTAQARSGELNWNLVRRFFDSAHLIVKWRVHPFPELGVSVALPTQAFAIESKGEGTKAFALGGVDQLAFFVGATPIAAEFAEAPDEALNSVLEGYTQTGAITWSAPMEEKGTRGREVLIDAGKEFIRVRVYVTREHLYQSILSSTAKNRLNSDEAKRFLGSMRWFE